MPSEPLVNDFFEEFPEIKSGQSTWNIVDYASIIALRFHTSVGNDFQQYVIVPAIDPSLQAYFLLSMSRKTDGKKITGPFIVTDGDGYATGFYSRVNVGGRSSITLRPHRAMGSFNRIMVDRNVVLEAIRDIDNIKDEPHIFGEQR